MSLTLTSVVNRWWNGVYTAGDTHVELLPKRWLGDGTRRGIIYHHGANLTNTAATTDCILDFKLWPNLGALLYALVAAGFPVIIPNLHGTKMGNSQSVADTASALTRLGALGAKTDKVGLAGGSMGNCAQMNYAHANPPKVACIWGWIPLCDLKLIWQTNNPAGISSAINDAYPPTYNDTTQGPTSNPAVHGASLAGIPTLLHYATDDPFIDPNTVTNLAALIGPSCTAVNLGTLGGIHGDGDIAAMSAAQQAAVVNHFATNLEAA